MDKAVAFIPVRLSSTRLPNKQLRLIGDHSLLSWVIKRIKDAKIVDQIVVCSPDEKASFPLKAICQKENVEFFLFEGDVNDVVGRLTDASRYYNADICVLASGDCPLQNSETIRTLVNLLLQDSNADTVSFAALNGRPVIHEGLLVMRQKVWQHAEKNSNTEELREHLFPVIYKQPDQFSNFKNISFSDEALFYEIDHRISVDTPSDLNFHRVLCHFLRERDAPYELRSVIELMKQSPQITQVNISVKQKGLMDKSRRVLFFITGISLYGYGNLMRAMEIANSCINRFGMGVDCVVMDASAMELVEKRHLTGVLFRGWDEFVEMAARYDIVVFDVNSSFMIKKDIVSKIASHVNVIVIDNVQAWAMEMDEIIVPTVHFTGEEHRKILHGLEYVVIREEVKDAFSHEIEKQNLVIVYSREAENLGFITQILNKLSEQHKDIKIEWFKEHSSEFLSKLATAKYYVSPLGVSSYEASYLGARTIIVENKIDAIKAIEKFSSFMKRKNVLIDGFGAERISERINFFAYAERS